MLEKIPLETSARHVHLSKDDLETLFGDGYELSPERELSQPGQFLSKERLVLIGPKAKIERVAILGPVREKTQVEISKTDCFSLGVSAPVRESGDLVSSASLRLEGPAGAIDLNEGVIIAKRHIHSDPTSAEALKIKTGDIVSVKIENSDRPLIFEDVVVRVDDSFKLTLHLDTDEANAAGLRPDSFGIIV